MTANARQDSFGAPQRSHRRAAVLQAQWIRFLEESVVVEALIAMGILFILLR